MTGSWSPTEVQESPTAPGSWTPTEVQRSPMECQEVTPRSSWSPTEVQDSPMKRHKVTPTLTDCGDETVCDDDQSWTDDIDDIDDDTLLALLQQSPQGVCDDSSDSTQKKGEHEGSRLQRAPVHEEHLPPHGTDATAPLPHWSWDPMFISNVESACEALKTKQWFVKEVFEMMDLTDFDRCVQVVINYVQPRVKHWASFKIGITENLKMRWYNQTFGYEREEWTKLYLLYAAPTSKTSIKEWMNPTLVDLRKASTGSMEKQLIKSLKEQYGTRCKNKEGAGGECPSDGNPHFTYLVVQDDYIKLR